MQGSIQQRANNRNQNPVVLTKIKKKNNNNNKRKKMNKGKSALIIQKHKLNPKSANSTVTALENLHAMTLSSYRRAIVAPEFVQNAKIPAVFPLPTTSVHMKTTVKFTTNSSGNAALLINPWYLSDASNNNSWILINNDVNLNLSTNPSMLTNFVTYSMQSRLTAGTAAAYRLVSAAVHIYPEMSINTAQGYIAGGIVTRASQPNYYPVGGTGNNPFGGAAAIASVIDQALYYQKSQIGGQAGIRCIYMPFDPTFDMFIETGTGRTSSIGTCDNFFWNYYVTGTQGNAAMIVEIYYNFEIEPLQEGVLQLLASKITTKENPDDALKFVANNSELVSQSSSNLLGLAGSIDQAIVSGRKTSFLDRTIDYISNHSGDVLNILSTVAKLF